MIGISWKNHKVNPDLYDMREEMGDIQNIQREAEDSL